jgi:hypothetical protein
VAGLSAIEDAPPVEKIEVHRRGVHRYMEVGGDRDPDDSKSPDAEGPPAGLSLMYPSGSI